MTTVAIARSGNIPPTAASTGTCHKKCPGGYKCTCDNATVHLLHICGHADCWCHSQDRYENRPYKGRQKAHHAR